MTQNNYKGVMMYIHGFMSGANGAKQKQLQRHYKDYRVIAPELDADPEKALNIINEIIKEENPEIIIGTSLGGWMTIMCDSDDRTQLVVVNPALFPEKTLAQWLNEEQTYFCERLDGVQTYTLTQDVLDKYKNYDAVSTAKNKINRLHALCSTKDELIGSRHIDALKPFMPEKRLMVVDDFGHQCRDAGMIHLYNILDHATKVIYVESTNS